MIRPLRKIKLDGTLYRRRPAVETEIQELTAISLSELERRAAICSRDSADFVSPEALVHFVRNAEGDSHREQLTECLLQRVFLLLPRDSGEVTVSLTKTNIRDDVVDHFIDLLLSERTAYDARLDYYEVNFNSAIAKDRKDASDRHWRRENRSEELVTDEEEVSGVAEATIDGYDPFDAQELDEKTYRLWLEEAIDSLPQLQRRIVVMWSQDIPIDSQDPSAVTISKALDKSEKTIRTHRDKAFATLRLRFKRKEEL